MTTDADNAADNVVSAINQITWVEAYRREGASRLALGGCEAIARRAAFWRDMLAQWEAS